MGSVDYLSYGFALVVLSGGVMGYLKVGKYKFEQIVSVVRSNSNNLSFMYRKCDVIG